MPRSVTALYKSQAEAEAVRARLTSIGIDPTGIHIMEETDRAEPGLFDKLARLILPDGASASFRLAAEVEPEQIEQAGRIVEEGAAAGQVAPREISEQTFIFRETAEQLVVEKEIAVREELVMRRTAEEHVEVVHDTVRMTEVQVERFGRDGRPKATDQR
jgi:hypothetical protein